MFLQTFRRRGAPIATLSFAAFMATLLPARAARAQNFSDPTDVTPAAHGVGGSATLGQPPPAAGSADALISVDPSTGAAHASLSFALPRARGDAQPSLSLSYDSFAGVGAAGTGWSLNLPSIERRNSSGFPRFIDGPPGPPSPDPAIDAGSNPATDPDDFAFAGQNLVPICTLTAQGTCGADSSVSFANFGGFTYFRTEIDNFARFFLSADRLTWAVEYQSGVWMYFGSSAGDNSAIETHDAIVNNANTSIYRWNLSSMTDAAGNLAVYRWAALDATDASTGSEQPTSTTGAGLKYLTDIYDTPGSGRVTASVDTYAHHTHLFWRGTDTDLQYSPGWKSVYARVLGDVAVASQTFAGSTERALVRLYHLGYSDPTQYEQRFLQSFELHACTQLQYESGGNIADPTTWAYSGACPMTVPTTLNYTQLSAFAPNLVKTHDLTAAFTPNGATGATGIISTGMFDVNGDGVSDLVATANSENESSCSTCAPYAIVVEDGVTGS